MKRFFLSLCCAVPFWSMAQQYPALDEKCASMHSRSYRIQQDPSLAARLQLSEQRAQQWLQQNGSVLMRNGIVTIPVVVHLVYNPSIPESNIHDSLIYSQIQILNEDFGRYNADTSNTRDIFDSIAVNVGVQFCLSSVDPNGNPTTGINRVSSTTSHFLTPFNNSVKSAAAGGADPWPADQYLNLWICDMSFNGSPFVLGYAQFPGDDPATDGVVIQYNYIGRTNDPNTAPSNLGRTTTHEVGHWLGLRHVWGDGDCTMDDFVCDTPDAVDQSNFDCNLSANTCDDLGNSFWGLSNPPDMVENYMDYSADACMNMFSRGQRDRMWSFLSTDRIGLFSSNGCGGEPLNAYTTLTHNPCQGFISGIAVVTPISGTPPYSFLWDDPNAQTDSIAVYLAEGDYTCRVVDADNDTIYVSVHIYDPSPLLIVSSSVQSATCSTCTDGEIAVGAVGGSAPLSYSLNGGPAQSDSLFTGLNPGTYTVEVTDVCNVTVTETFTVGNSVGIDAQVLEQQFQLMPNPAQDQVTLQFGSQRYFKQVSFLNAVGALVQTDSGTFTSLSVDLKQFAPGIYFVRLELAGAVLVRKLIVE
jgi:hypothetical protein